VTRESAQVPSGGRQHRGDRLRATRIVYRRRATEGGIKQFRVLLLTKAAGWEVQRTLLPRTAVVERMELGDGRP